MVSFHKTFTFFWKSTKGVNVNKLVLNAEPKSVAKEVRLPRPGFGERKKKNVYKIGGVACFMLIMPVTSFGLGIWQALRKIEKTQMIRNLKEKSNSPPVDLPEDLNELKNMEFRPVRVKGKFDYSKEIYIGPRPIHKEKSLDTSSLLSIPKGGYLIITPFTLSDRNLRILVNRGWVPKSKISAKSLKEDQIEEEVELVGLVKLTEKRPHFSFRNQPEKGIWLYKDIEEMAAAIETSPVLIEAVKSSSVPGGPIGGQTNITLKDDHVAYMLSWFGMSLVTGWMWYNRYIRKVKVMGGVVF